MNARAQHVAPPTANGQVVEKRRHPRRRVLKQARIIFNNRFSVVDCTVRDLSLSGCRIRLQAPLVLPHAFIVAFPLLEVERPARLVWQNELEAGVEFLDPPPPAYTRVAMLP